MRYDIGLIRELCREVGMAARLEGTDCIEIDLGEGAILCFQNEKTEDDCLSGFRDTPWHTHGNFMFADARGYCVELDYLDVVVGLKDGRVLICEQLMQDRITDRWLTHHECNDEFKYLKEDERLVVRRAMTNAGRG